MTEYHNKYCERFLLCSDGFWEYVLEPEMEQDLQAAADPQDWLDRMLVRLNRRIPAHNDNNTAATATNIHITNTFGIGFLNFCLKH